MIPGFHGDTLLHRERTFELIDQPLETYFDLIGQRPALCRGPGRGYAAQWVVEDGWLFMASVAGRWDDEQPLSLDQLFPFGGSKVFAAWYSGTIRGYRRDRPLPRVDDPAQARYPDIVLTVASGRLGNASVVHRPHFESAERASSPATRRTGAQVVDFVPRAAGAEAANWTGTLV